MDYKYNFPRCTKAESVFGELKHAAGEIIEACDEPDYKEKTMEILDAIECLENALRILVDQDELNVILAKHYNKNLHRGYYE